MRSMLTVSISAIAVIAASASYAGTVKYYGDFDPAPLAAMQEVIKAFEAANPDIKVEFQNFDHEGYKTAIRNFLSADAPDLANWYAGNRMAPFVNSGQFMDVSDVWEEHGLKDSLASALASMTIDGKQWGVPYTYYQWGIYYNKDVYKQVGAEVPATWDEFIANCALFKEAGIDCVTTGTKALWPGAGIFDYMNLRTNGYEFHMDLANGKIPWMDDRVKATFAEWAGGSPAQFPIQKAWRARSRTSPERLGRALDALARADLQLKSMPEATHRVTMERLTVALCQWYGGRPTRRR